MWPPSRCRTSAWTCAAVPLSSWVARRNALRFVNTCSVFLSSEIQDVRLGPSCAGKNTMIRKALEIGHEQHPEALGFRF